MTNATPAGWHSVTPRLVVSDPARLVEFLKQAFGATGDLQTERPSVIRIGDSLVMISSVGPREAMFSTSMLTTPILPTSALWKQARCRSKSRWTRPMAIGVGWSRIRAGTFGKSQLTKDRCYNRTPDTSSLSQKNYEHPTCRRSLPGL